MSRIRLLLILTTMMVVGLVACYSDSGEPESTSPPTTTHAASSNLPPAITDDSPIATESESETTDVESTPGQRPDRSARRDDGSLGITFRVSVPPETPPNSTILMTGDRPALGSGVEMKPLNTNPLVYEAEVVFGHDGTLHYRFELNGVEAVSSPKRVETDFDGQVVNDRIASWSSTQ